MCIFSVYSTPHFSHILIPDGRRLQGKALHGSKFHQLQGSCNSDSKSNTSLIAPTICTIFIHYIYLLCFSYMFWHYTIIRENFVSFTQNHIVMQLSSMVTTIVTE
jgi:hypothetical protein